MSRPRRKAPAARPVARLTTPAQLVAALPIQLGFTPTESLVVVCGHEPRGRVGLSMRIDLPEERCEPLLVDEVVRRVRHDRATRVSFLVYTEAGGDLPREELVQDLRLQLEDLVVNEALLVRGGRFWSYVCSRTSCCPPEGRPLDEGDASAPVQLLAAENVLAGRVVLPDRAALAASLAGPRPLLAELAGQRCEKELVALSEDLLVLGPAIVHSLALRDWRGAVEAARVPPSVVAPEQAARLAASLTSKQVRDEVATWVLEDEEPLIALLGDLCRATPAPYDAPVATLYGWTTYATGAGAAVVIALERALVSDPDCSMAQLLLELLQGQVAPAQVRQMLAQEARRTRRAS